jgi:hypothetical protein
VPASGTLVPNFITQLSLKRESKQIVGARAPEILGTSLALLWQICFTPRSHADPPSAVRALLKRTNDEVDDGVAHGWQGWLSAVRVRDRKDDQGVILCARGPRHGRVIADVREQNRESAKSAQASRASILRFVGPGMRAPPSPDEPRTNRSLDVSQTTV